MFKPGPCFVFQSSLMRYSKQRSSSIYQSNLLLRSCNTKWSYVSFCHNFTNSSVLEREPSHEKVSKLIQKIERLGRENKMSTLSHVLTDASRQNTMGKLLDLSVALAKIPHGRQSNNLKYHSTERSALSYIIDSFLKERSPMVLELLELLDSDSESLRFFTTNKLIVASNYISSHIRMLKKVRGAEMETNLAFYHKLLTPASKDVCNRYIDDLQLPGVKIIEELSFASPYEKSLLHMHVVTKHLAKWCYTARLDDEQIGLKVLKLHDCVRKTVKYSPILTATLMMHNLRSSLKYSVKLVNKFCSSIFFTTCVEILQNGGSLETIQRFYEISSSNGLVDFSYISYDGYGLALKKLFEGYAYDADAKNIPVDRAFRGNHSRVTNDLEKKRILTQQQWMEVNYFFSFLCENTIAAAKLRYLFIQTALSYCFTDVAIKLSAFLQSQQIPLGTIAINYNIRVFARNGDYNSVRYFIQFASNEAQKNNLLVPPTQLDIGLDQSSLSSFLIGAEAFASSFSPEDRLNKHYQSRSSAIVDILINLLDRVGEYKLAPQLSLFQRILDFNAQYTLSCAIAFRCVQLALREGKQRPRELCSQVLLDLTENRNFKKSENGVASKVNCFDPNMDVEVDSKEEVDSNDEILASYKDYSLEIKKFFSDAVIQLCDGQGHNHMEMHRSVEQILESGQKIDPIALNRVFHELISLGKYRMVIELFENLSDRDIPRSFEQASAVIEALANLNRFSDCWRSISSLKVHIFRQIQGVERGNQMQLFSRTKCLCAYASKSLLQLIALSKGDDRDQGKTKLSREDLLLSILYCIEIIVTAHDHIPWGVSRYQSNSQDILLAHLALFRLYADPDLVAALLRNIKQNIHKGNLLVEFLSSVNEEGLPSDLRNTWEFERVSTQ